MGESPPHLVPRHNLAATWRHAGRNLDAPWRHAGHNLATTWPQPPGHNLEATWRQPDRNMDATWQQHGRNTDATWTQHKRNLDASWTLPAATWPQTGRWLQPKQNLVATWPQPGRNLAATCQWPQPGRNLDSPDAIRSLLACELLSRLLQPPPASAVSTAWALTNWPDGPVRCYVGQPLADGMPSSQSESVCVTHARTHP